MTSIPKYLMIAQQLMGAIRSGELSAGARVPSENELIAEHGVSNTTARKALNYLDSRGWIQRERGRGSFVSSQNVHLSLDRILDFTTNAIRSGAVPSTRILDVRVGHETPIVRMAGGTFAIEGGVCRVERLCLANDVPIMLERRYVSTAVCPGIEQMDLSGNLYELYERHFELTLDYVQQDLSVVALDSGRTMGLFQLEKPIPAIRVQGATLAADGRLVELEEAFYRSDRHRFSVIARR